MAAKSPERGIVVVKPIVIDVKQEDVVENKSGGVAAVFNIVRGVITRIQEITQVDLGGKSGLKDKTDIGLGDAKNPATIVTAAFGGSGVRDGGIFSLPNSGINFSPSSNPNGDGDTGFLAALSAFRGDYTSTGHQVTDETGKLVSGAGELTVNGTQVNVVIGARGDGGAGVGIKTPAFTAAELHFGPVVKRKRTKFRIG